MVNFLKIKRIPMLNTLMLLKLNIRSDLRRITTFSKMHLNVPSAFLLLFVIPENFDFFAGKPHFIHWHFIRNLLQFCQLFEILENPHLSLLESFRMFFLKMCIFCQNRTIPNFTARGEWLTLLPFWNVGRKQKNELEINAIIKGNGIKNSLLWPAQSEIITGYSAREKQTVGSRFCYPTV